MSQLEVGAQTIPWGENIRAAMENILRFLRSEGYAGVETGVRHFDTKRPDYYRDLYRQLGLVPLGLHSGGQFWEPGAAQRERAKLLDSARFAAAVGFRHLVVSGNRDETPESMSEAARTYASIGGQCRDLGLRFAYHNHNWELADNARILEVLLQSTRPEEVSLVLDVAWVHLAGMALRPLLDRFGDRVAYIHLKDAAGDRFCELGTGEVALDETLRLIQDAAIPWIVIEQDYTTLTAEESMRINRSFLRTRGL